MVIDKKKDEHYLFNSIASVCNVFNISLDNVEINQIAE